MQKLSVYEGSVTTDGGGVHQQHLVVCPNRTSISLEECVGCKDNAGKSMAGAPLRSFVLCRVPPFSRAWQPQALVADLMATQVGRVSAGERTTSPAYSVNVCDPVSLALDIMARESVQQLTVMSDDAQVLGLVTALDLVRWFASPRA